MTNQTDNQKNKVIKIASHHNLLLSTKTHTWTFESCEINESPILNIKINGNLEKSFESINLRVNEIYLLSRGLLKAFSIKTSDNEEIKMGDTTIASRSDSNITISLSKNPKLYFNGSKQGGITYLPLNGHHAQLIRMKSLELISHQFPSMPKELILREMMLLM